MAPLPKSKRQQLTYRRTLAKFGGANARLARLYAAQGRRFFTPRPNPPA